MSLTNIKLAYEEGHFTGTSCAAPVFAAMCALVQGYFLENAGEKLSNEELLIFIKGECIDIEKKGPDEKTGYGLFTLPDPKYIEIEKEASEMRYIKLKDVPAGEFHDTIKSLIERGIIKGYSGSGEDTVVDLSEDMIRIFVTHERAGVYKK